MQHIVNPIGLGLVVAGIHVIINFLVAAGSVSLVFNVMEEWSARTAFAGAEGHDTRPRRCRKRL